ncbi:hypothetical protein SNS2_0382 [Streptomyces netropsis]|nr:hypothetical protein SNS2_0382 [Streptomyces netropsis]
MFQFDLKLSEAHGGLLGGGFTLHRVEYEGAAPRPTFDQALFGELPISLCTVMSATPSFLA